jgi:hypothetical protein
VRKSLAALAALAGLVHVGGATAGSIWLPSPNQPVIPPPPLLPGVPPTQRAELRVPGRVENSELVNVGIGPDGTPLQVAATQRIRLFGTGDYSFMVPAPAISVVPGKGTESQPGLRDVGIIWQGFSDRHRLLSVTATLRPAAAAAGLPLRVQLRRQGSSAVVRLVDVARRSVVALNGRTTLARVTTVLRQHLSSYRRSHLLAGPLYVQGKPGDSTKIDVSAPLHVTGVIAQGSSHTNVDELLGGARPLERSLVIPGATAPAVRLRVDLLPVLEILPTPRELAASPRPLRTLQAALGAVAASSSYRRYLASPDPAGRSQASYVYRSVPKPAVAAAGVPRSHSSLVLIVLAVALGAAGLAGLAVLWARS